MSVYGGNIPVKRCNHLANFNKLFCVNVHLRYVDLEEPSGKLAEGAKKACLVQLGGEYVAMFEPRKDDKVDIFPTTSVVNTYMFEFIYTYEGHTGDAGDTGGGDIGLPNKSKKRA